MRRNTTLLFNLFIIILIMSACDGKTDESACMGDYDQQALYTNLADNLIVPSFQNLRISSSNLDTEITSFVDEPTTTKLTTVRTAFRTTYLAWQKVEYFNFGPSEAIQLNTKINNFPLNTALLEANISIGQYNLDSPDNYYSGLPALDYLLYGVGEEDNVIISKYTTDENAAAYRDYLSAVILLMKNKINTANNNWENTYRDDFVTNTGTADGTAIGLILNSLNENFEKTRRDRLGIPSGFHDINVPAFPDRVEAFYSGLSLELLKVNMQTAKDYFTGMNGEGIDDYLEFSGVKKEGINLEDAINNQFDAIINNVNAIPETLPSSIVDETGKIQNVYVPLANQVVNLKTDTPSALCVSITYIDNASDSD
ncbi:MAG: putative lipoprotein [Maribacter sp.]|jgi:predicted lipoprotein